MFWLRELAHNLERIPWYVRDHQNIVSVGPYDIRVWISSNKTHFSSVGRPQQCAIWTLVGTMETDTAFFQYLQSFLYELWQDRASKSHAHSQQNVHHARRCIQGLITLFRVVVPAWDPKVREHTFLILSPISCKSTFIAPLTRECQYFLLIVGI